MNKHLIVIGTAVLLLVVGLSGCAQNSQQQYNQNYPYPAWHIVSYWDCSPIYMLEEDGIVNFYIQRSATKWKIELIREWTNKDISVEIHSPNYQHLFDEITSYSNTVEKVYSVEEYNLDYSTTRFFVVNTGCKCQITISEFAMMGTC